jgi:hypothetical protein
VLPTTGSARDYQLNRSENSKSIRDIAPINGNSRELPYETLEKNGLAVSYNLLAGYLGNTYGYQVRLIFRNTNQKSVIVYPKVFLYDGDGFALSDNIKSVVSRAYEKKREVSVNLCLQNDPWNKCKNVRKERERANDDVMLTWVDSFWISQSYDIPSETAATGALFYPVADVGKLPLRLVVDLNGERLEFLTNRE